MIRNLNGRLFGTTLLSLLISCENDINIRKGIVNEKLYESPREVTEEQLGLVGGVAIWYEKKYIDDEDFILKVCGLDLDAKEICLNYYVPKEVYDKINIGDVFDEYLAQASLYDSLIEVREK